MFVEGNYEEAKRQYIRILHIDPDLLETLYNLGRVYEMEGNFPEAEKQYREALRIDPNDSDAKASLEKVLLKLKRKQPGK